jgi:hypothetical protein
VWPDLTAAIRVVWEPCRWVAVRQRHDEGTLDQIHGRIVAHRPANHEARRQNRLDIGEVSCPHPIWQLDPDRMIESVLGHEEPILGLFGSTPTSTRS